MGPRLLMAVFSVLVVIVVSNNSAGSLSQPAIGREFAAGPADVGWIVFGFGTTFAMGTAIWGGLARRFGIGRCLAVGILLFSGGSLATALVQAGGELPLFAGRPVPGFSTTLVLLALGPAIALVVGSRRPGEAGADGNPAAEA